MVINLERLVSTADFTLGVFEFEGNKYCTCEDAIRLVKIPTITCIPEGKYKVEITHSNRFKKDMPILLNVPNFTGIRIHCGNFASNTEGCILVGKRMLSNGVADSREAYEEFFRKLKKRLMVEEVWINITNPNQIWEATHESSKAADVTGAGPTSSRPPIEGD